MYFCPRCFGSEENSSWHGEVTSGACYNCGSGPTVDLPEWAIKEIRKQASWVGKRYYPSKEDTEIQQELEDLRSIAPPSRGRYFDPATRWVYQPLPTGNTCVSVPDDIKTDEEALEWAKTRLPWRK